MELTDSCKILTTKGTTQKVKCCKFFSSPIERELAIHEDVDNKNKTSISDTTTGVRLFGLETPANKTKMNDVQERLDKFIKHFTIEEIGREFKRLEGDKVIDG